MQMNALLAEIASHPVVRAAALQIAVEVADGGIGHTVEKVLDRAAYSVAKRIVEEKKQIKREQL